MKLLKIFANQYFWLTVILILGFWVRLYKIESPIADWHSWRQADTAAVTRNFFKEGFNPLLPKYDDMSGVSETPVINPQRFRFVEFPIYNIVVYPLYLLFGQNVIYDRLISIIFSLGSALLIFFIVKKYTGIGAGLLSAFTFSLLPFNVFFSRTTLPEPTFIFFALGMLYFMDRWIWERKTFLGVFGFVFTALAFLIKPWAIFFFLPLLYSVLVKSNTRKFWLKFIIFTALSLTPFILWRLWMLQQPEGIPAANWLLNADGIRFRPAFWWWIISERLGREILGATGMVLFFIGLLVRPKNGNYFLHLLVLSGFFFIAIFATGNVRHNYYQIQIIPAVSIFFSLGFIQLLSGNRLFIPRILAILLAFFLFSLSFFFSFKVVSEFYRINNPDMIEAGSAADRILPEDAKVLALYNGDTAFLYQTNRPGFAVAGLPIPELVTDYGVSAYVSTIRDGKTNWVLRHFEILIDNPKFIIADLTKIKFPLNIQDPEP